jgi:hypothetical protein
MQRSYIETFKCQYTIVSISLSLLAQWTMSSGKEDTATPSASHDSSRRMKIDNYPKEKLHGAIGNLTLALHSKNVCLLILQSFSVLISET